MANPVYVIGDVHGQIDFLEQALTWIETDGGADAEIIVLGDLVDRGPAPDAVIERLKQGQAAGRPWRVIKGNHDRLFSRFVRTGTVEDPHIRFGLDWLHRRLGGVETLAAYGVAGGDIRPHSELMLEAQEKVPEAHLDYLENLPLFVERNGLLFVHAGLRPGTSLADQSEEDLIWIRDEFLNDPREHPWLVVHGHTAIDVPFHYGNRVNLDGGAGYGRPIYPAVFEGRDCWLLDEAGRLPLVP